MSSFTLPLAPAIGSRPIRIAALISLVWVLVTLARVALARVAAAAARRGRRRWRILIVVGVADGIVHLIWPLANVRRRMALAGWA